MEDILRSDARVADDIERVYRDHGDRLWWSVLAYSGDREIASDAVAEAFAQALRRGDDLRSPIAWIWKAAFRIAAGELRQGRGTWEGELDRIQAAADVDQTQTVLAALRRLSSNQRAAVVLHYYADRPVSEVASIMGCSAATVAVHLHRGRRRLRDLLGGDDD